MPRRQKSNGVLPPITQQIDQVEVATLLFSAALEFFSVCGLSDADAAKAFSQARKSGGPKKFPSDPMVMILATCLRHWHTSDPYTNSAGTPMLLARQGVPSLTSLIEDCGFTEPEKIISTGIGLGCFTQHGSKFLPKDREAFVPDEGSLSLWYGAQSAQRALKSMTRNVRLGTTTPKLFHRTAHQLALGEKHVALFKRFASDQGTVFIQMMDDWMEQHRATTPSEESVPVSIHTFAWIEDEPKKNLDSTAAIKKRSKVIQTKNRNS